VTTFELFFDLVYVFAATQVTGYMAHAHTGHGVVQGLLLLALLWWTWSAYAWLGNQARADEGVLRAGMAVAMAAIFVVALTVPEAWQDAPGGLSGPLVGGWAQTLLFIGAGAAAQPISAPLLLGAVLGVAVAAGLWWLYFDVASLAAEHRLAEVQGQARARLALEAYTFGHFPIVAGIVLTALGVEGVLAHAGDSEPLGGFYAASLFGGAALYLAGELVFKQRLHGTPSLPRLVAVGVLLAALPAAIALPPLAGLAGLVLVLAALILVETTRYAQTRRSLRNT
jgi:low temperature requirement protein LtrA